MLGVGDRADGYTTVWTAPHERHSLDELLREGPALFVFYLFDWSGT
jgi:hypothetical protein